MSKIKLYEATDAPARELTKLMISLSNQEWIEIFLDENSPKHIELHIKKYFKITNNVNFITTIVSLIKESYSQKSTGTNLLWAIYILGTKNKTISEALLNDLKSLCDITKPNKRKTSTKKVSVVETIIPPVIEEEVKKEDKEDEVKIVENNPLPVEMKLNLTTKYGFISSMQVGFEQDRLFNGFFVKGSKTIFFIDGLEVSINEFDSVFLSEIFAFLETNGIIQDDEISNNLWILTKPFKQNHSFFNTIDENYIVSKFQSSGATSEDIVHISIKQNLPYIFKISELALSLTKIDSDFTRKEFKRLGINLDSLLSI